ncbi:MAG: DsrE family protein [Rhodospirillales bacterium]|nr:DsrE family protein [Rhodospirillales bacterium]
MPNLTRRGAFGAIAGGTVLAAGAASAAPPTLKLSDLKKEADTACLYHCDYGDDVRYDAMLRNINNHLSVYDSDPFALKIVIVAHAAGIKYHLKTLEGTTWAGSKIDPDFDKRTAALGQLGVDVLLCRLTFERNKIDIALAKDAPYIKIVPSGVATVAALQGKGYAYLKCG